MIFYPKKKLLVFYVSSNHSRFQVTCIKANLHLRPWSYPNPYLTNYGQKAYFWTFKNLLGYWLSRLSAKTQKNNSKKSKKFKKSKTRKYWQLTQKMCLSCVYYSKFGCCGS
jgi:hypothetical protein